MGLESDRLLLSWLSSLPVARVGSQIESTNSFVSLVPKKSVLDVEFFARAIAFNRPQRIEVTQVKQSETGGQHGPGGKK